MVNVNAKNERVYVKVSGDYVFGSVLVSGGKDAKGKAKANGFVNVKFSNQCQDNIFAYFKGNIPNVIVLDMDGFIAWNEYNNKSEAHIVVTEVNNIHEYVKEEQPFKRGNR